MIRKKRGSGGGGGEMESAGMMRWLLTYADMITLLLIFFIVMYSASAQEQELVKKILESLNNTFGGGVVTGGKSITESGTNTEKVPFSISTNRMQIAGVTRQMQNVFSTLPIPLFKSALIRREERGLVISLLTDGVLFDRGKVQLREETKKILKEIAKVVVKIPNQIVVEGHTDDLQTSGALSNWEISAERATSVVKYLVDHEKVQPSRLSAAGFAQYKPLVDNLSDTNRALNRRVDIVVLQLEARETQSFGGGQQRKGYSPLVPEQTIPVNVK